MYFEPKIIDGGSSSDLRGTINFVNDFRMDFVKRFYVIENANTEIVRGWRGHKIEQRWFYVINGSFVIKVLRIDDWKTPDKSLCAENYQMSADDSKVLHIPAGYATSIKASCQNSKLLVFADYPMEHAKEDDYLFPHDYFINNEQN